MKATPLHWALGGLAALLGLGLMSGSRGSRGGGLSSSAGASVASVASQAARLWQGLVESMPQALPLIKDYWAAAGLPFPGVGEPWSGAFVSWVVRQSSTPNAITPSGAHVYYARQAYLDRGRPGRYGAFRPEEVQVEPGDILIRSRAGAGAKFSDLQQSGGGFIPMHGDIVTSVSPFDMRVVGGNVDDSVKERMMAHAGGVVSDPGVIAVLKLQRSV